MTIVVELVKGAVGGTGNTVAVVVTGKVVRVVKDRVDVRVTGELIMTDSDSNVVKVTWFVVVVTTVSSVTRKVVGPGTVIEVVGVRVTRVDEVVTTTEVVLKVDVNVTPSSVTTAVTGAVVV